jgi:hypothetical protein
MTREFVRTKLFDELWEEIGLDDDDLIELEKTILRNPQAGTVIPGLNGVRKLRFAAKGHGKRGGARVIYLDIVVYEQTHLIIAYPKGTKDDMTTDEKKALSRYVDEIKSQGRC